MIIDGRKVPDEVIYEYIDHLLFSHDRVLKYGFNVYDDIRSELHNNIFLAAGFKDKPGKPARRRAAFFNTIHCDSNFKTDPDVGYE